MNAPHHDRPRVLVADDELSLRESLAELLVHAGFDVLEAANGVDAARLIASEKLDVVVSDIVMPLGSGVDLLKLVREQPNGPVVILMSGMPSVETARQAVRLQAFEYLLKPIRAVDLVACARRAVDTKRARDADLQQLRSGQEQIRDLSDTVRRRSAELRESVERYSELVNGLEIVAFEIDRASLQVTHLAGKLRARLWPNLQDEPWQVNLLHGLHPADRELLAEHLQQAKVDGPHLKLRYDDVRGQRVYVDCILSRGESGRADRVTGVLVDVSARVLAEKERQRVMLELGEAREQLQRRLVEGLASERDEPAVRVTKSGNVREAGMVFGASPAMREVRRLADVATTLDEPVLIGGETGTGKGALAEWIHQRSRRSSKSFVAVNCASLRGDLMSAELFGHAKGAFTSADRHRKGLVEEANGGTLFLDEIGELDAEAQARLLKVLEDKTFRRVGETQERRSDFRLLSATHRDLEAMAALGTFRRDLLYRINVFTLALPPLRERGEDLRTLAEHLMAGLGAGDIELPDDTMSVLRQQPWRGNVRELRNALIRALLLSGGAAPQPEHLVLPTVAPVARASARRSELPGPPSKPPPRPSVPPSPPVDDELTRLMARFDGNKAKVARALGVSRSTLYRRLEALDPPPAART